MCRNIERGVFRASLDGTHFLLFFGGMLMKKLLSTLLALCLCVSMCFSLSGCLDIMGEDPMDGMIGKPNTNSYYLGETADIGNGVKFVINSVRDTTKIGYNETENNYIVITYTIKNESDKAWSQNPNDVTLLLDNTEFTYSSATYSLENSASGFDEINPGLSKTFSIAFETSYKSNERTYKIKFSEFVLYGESSVSIFLCENPN